MRALKNVSKYIFNQEVEELAEWQQEYVSKIIELNN